MDDTRQAIACVQTALRGAPEIVRDYVGVHLLAASRSKFVMRYVAPEFGIGHSFLFYVPGGRFRNGSSSPSQLMALVNACNAIRMELDCRGHHLPERLEIESVANDG